MWRQVQGLMMVLGLILAATPAGAKPQEEGGRARPFDEIVVFGDSLSDIGNANGGRFSNGPVWVEHLARRFGLSLQPSRVGGTDFAYGGARIQGPASSHSLRAQVDAFLAAHRPEEMAGRRVLYVVYGGGNDLREALWSPDPIAAARGAITTLQGILADLAAAGARDILVPNLPNLGRIPEIRERGPEAATVATVVSLGFNQALENSLKAFEGQWRKKGLRLYRLDVFGLLEEVVADPARAGFSDPETPCRQYGGTRCADPDRHLFWDGLHPSAAGHARLGAAAVQALGPMQR